jgi:aminopeptidase N
MSFIEDVTTPTHQYTYTNFKPNGAHRFVPCFDQPDLKARASFTVIVPNGWMSASNEAEAYHGEYSLAAY